jgi:hypothetical protein
MLQSKYIGSVFSAAVVLAALATYTTGRALGQQHCLRACDLVTKVCSTDANSKCTNYYTYTNSASSCWICGDGSPGNGMCYVADATLQCQQASNQLQWQQYQSGLGWCSWSQQVNNPNSWTDCFDQTNPMQVFGMETRYLCVERGS